MGILRVSNGGLAYGGSMRGPYDTVHDRKKDDLGPANAHDCVECGAQASDWSYSHSAGENELIDERRRLYSENLDDYAARCKSCHTALDIAMMWADPEQRERAAERAREQWKDPEFREQMTQTLREMARDPGRSARQSERNRQRWKDPVYREKMLKAMRDAPRNREASRRTANVRRQCAECYLVSNAMGIGRHQKSSGHEGWEEFTDDPQ